MLIKGHQLTSRYAPVREAEIQASLIPEGAEEAWCYGVGNGELVRACLRRGVKVLHVVRMNQEAMDAADLSGTDIPRRVCFTEPLAASVKTLRVPFACSPVEVMHADPDAWHLRDRIRAVLNEEYNGRRLAALASAKWNGNATDNRELGDPPVTEMFKSRIETAVVCGAGPTLTESYSFIRRHPMASVITVSTALRPLQAANIFPTATCMIDEAAEMVKHVEGTYTSSALAYRISVNPAVPRIWTGKRFVIGDDDLFRGGSVIHVAVDLAVKMGAHTVYLAGCDFGYPNMQSHVDGAPTPTATPALLEYRNGRGATLRTDENLCQYRIYLEEYIRMHPEVKFYKLGRAGAEVAGAEWVDA